jgi:predicted dienelactone hydrolase
MRLFSYWFTALSITALKSRFSKFRAVLTRRTGFALGLAIALTLSQILPVHASEQLFLKYSPFEFSVAIKSLEQFAETGAIEKDLGFILNRFEPEQQEQFRRILTLRNELDPVILSRVAYTITGERLLQKVGEMIQTKGGQNGFYALRAAVQQAADDDTEGFTFLNLLKQFPTDIQIDIKKVLRFVGGAKSLVEDTVQVMQSLDQQSQQLASTQPSIDVNTLPNLQTTGSFTVVQRNLDLYDQPRSRSISTSLYLPESSNTTPGSIPVIVVSNGLGSTRDRFSQLAQHLASHGFAVVIPDHIGSNDRRQKGFFRGEYDENFDATEFVNRPLDVTYVLNQLEQRNASEFGDRLNLKTVGMFGYSFGGTTALSLAGGQFDFSNLPTTCSTELNLLNISTLYQCRALELKQRQIADLRDRRIAAVMVYVPYGKYLWGESGLSQIQVPVLWQAVDEDIITPLILEGLPSYKQLTGRDRFLVVSKGLPHTRITLRLVDRFLNTNRSDQEAELNAVTQRYLESLSLAFLKSYITQDDSYRPYLQARGVEAIAEQPYSLRLVQDLLQ